MAYTLKQLKAVVPKILNAGHINTPLKGYPILHQVFLALEYDSANYEGYISLIKTILSHPQCNPDVLDQYGIPLLAYACAGEHRAVLFMLLFHHANPDFIHTKHSTPLEWAIEHNPSSSLIPILNQCTARTQTLLANCQAMFNDALELAEENVDLINILLDLKLVTYNRQFQKHLKSSPDVPVGFWIRTIADPKKERDILQKRNKLTDSGLAKQRHTTSADPGVHYTIYSCATYVRQNIPICIFGYEAAGLMIHPTADPIAYWFDGHNEELTRDFSYQEGADLSNGLSKGQFWELTPQQIQTTIEDFYLQEVKRSQEIARESKDEDHYRFDKHGVMLDKMLCDIYFRWNEGLMRYKSKQIFGILVNPENETSCKRAFNIKKTLGLTVPFYDYRVDTGTTHEVSENRLVQKWNLEVSAVDTGSATVKPLIMSKKHQLPKPEKVIADSQSVMHPRRSKMLTAKTV